MNSELIFSISPIDLHQVSDYLDSENWSFEVFRCGKYLRIKVYIGHDPGKAGRCFDIGRAVGAIEHGRTFNNLGSYHEKSIV